MNPRKGIATRLSFTIRTIVAFVLKCDESSQGDCYDFRDRRVRGTTCLVVM
jgi:hypothetical protein